MDTEGDTKQELFTDNNDTSCLNDDKCVDILLDNECEHTCNKCASDVDVNNVDIHIEKTENILPEVIFNNNGATDDSSSDYETSFENVFERIEDKRYSDGETNDKTNYSLLGRRVVSENDLSLVGGISKLKSKVEDKIRSSGKICKECFVQSIQSHLSLLGIVSTGHDASIEAGRDERSFLIEKEKEDEAGGGECSKDNIDADEQNLIKSIHRRTLSEIDWHELTRFAQGELFDPESSTAMEIKRVIEEGKDELSVAFKMMHQMDFEYVVEEAEKCVQCVINTGWRVVSHWELPQWLRDNDFLWHSHRPQLPSLKDCFCSMFRVHTESGNIWTHFIGLILIVIAMLVINLRPLSMISDYPNGWEEYMVFGAFFIGAICCLGFSWLFHTCSCHSKKTSQLLSKLDYAGIAFMIMGSFTPCIYYGFYCRYTEKIVYLSSEVILGISSIIVALWDKFATPAFRPIRAGLFLALGCSGIIPVIHMLVLYGLQRGAEQGAVGWLIVMGLCYIIGAILYAMRVPERFFPGKCNIFFQSHQIFHVLVVAGALLHLHGCCKMATYRVKAGRNCTNPMIPFVPVTGSPASNLYQGYPLL